MHKKKWTKNVNSLYTSHIIWRCRASLGGDVVDILFRHELNHLKFEFERVSFGIDTRHLMLFDLDVMFVFAVVTKRFLMTAILKPEKVFDGRIYKSLKIELLKALQWQSFLTTDFWKPNIWT